MSHGPFNSNEITTSGASSALLSEHARREAVSPCLIVVHPTPLLRRGVAAAIADAGLARSVTGFSDLAKAAEALAGARAGDVILVDAPMWQHARARDPGLVIAERGARLALIASSDFPSTRLQGVRGVCGVICCNVSPQAMAQAVVDLAAGRDVFPKTHATGPASGLARLSNRQFEILELMTRGLLNKQIAWELGLTEGTVKSHVSAILEKLGCDRRTQAIAAFMQSFGIAGRSLTA
jgi:DNA-binding NarL/FixJ family response regulator